MAMYLTIDDFKDDPDGADISDEEAFDDVALRNIIVKSSAMVNAKINFGSADDPYDVGLGYRHNSFEQKEWRFDRPIIRTRYNPVRWVFDLQLALAIDDSDPTGFAMYGIDTMEVRWPDRIHNKAPITFGKIFVNPQRDTVQAANPIYGMPPVTFWALPDPLSLLTYSSGYDWGKIPTNATAAPTGAPTVTPLALPQPNVTGLTFISQVNAGSHVYTYAFVNGDDDWRSSESILSPASAPVVNTPSLNGNQLTVPVGPEGTVARRIYRTTANDDNGLPWCVGEISDNFTTTYVDQMTDEARPFARQAYVPSAPDGLIFPYPPWLTQATRMVCRAMVNARRLAWLDGLQSAKVADTSYMKPRTIKGTHPSPFPQEADDLLATRHQFTMAGNGQW